MTGDCGSVTLGGSNEWLIDGVSGRYEPNASYFYECMSIMRRGGHTCSEQRGALLLLGTPLSAGVAGIIDASSLDAQLQCLATQVRSDGTANFRTHRRSIV